ncbi:MAG: sugar porter family MFS transporter [Ignavibacteria bacterium]|jgi:sugar porter (SP) family MFS transporter|nr:sugar porter family MFS transporter [Ignavibacteria bacterium]MCU7521174.1 sugar porter family MFS transporter [Ignavibacteria bacterium]
MKERKTVFFAAAAASLGGFLFGFDTAVISGAEKAIQQLFQLDSFWHGFTIAIALIGTVIGALSAGKPADLYGRKASLIVIALFFCISAVGSGLANSWEMFLVFRFIGGLGIGASSVVGPMYISEISPSHLRGRLVAFFQLNIVIGILVSFFSNYLFSALGEGSWRWMLGVAFFPGIIFLSLIFFIPNSPRWLVKRGRISEARDILKKIGEKNAEGEIKEITESLRSEAGAKKEKLLSSEYKKPVAYAMLLAIFNQFSGINAILYFSPRIFEMAGFQQGTAMLQSVSIGLTNFLFTIIAMTIIDRFGRRTLLIVGSLGMIVSLGMVSFTFFTKNFGSYNMLVYLISFIAFFAFSQGAVIWVFISEIFPNKVRAKGQTLGSSTHWIVATIISWTFPFVAENPAIGGGPSFLFFALMMLLQLLFVLKYLPETKGKSLEQIERDLQAVPLEAEELN